MKYNWTVRKRLAMSKLPGPPCATKLYDKYSAVTWDDGDDFAFSFVLL